MRRSDGFQSPLICSVWARVTNRVSRWSQSQKNSPPIWGLAKNYLEDIKAYPKSGHVHSQSSDRSPNGQCARRTASPLVNVLPVCGILFVFASFPLRAEGPAIPPPASPPAKKVSLSDDANGLLRKAGNAATDAERLVALRELRARPDLPEGFRADLERMIEYVALWVDGYELTNHSDKYLVNPVMRASTLKAYAPEHSSGTLLNALVPLYLARVKVHDLVQQYTGKYLPLDAEARKEFVNDRLKKAQDALKAFPDNPIMKMYTGRPLPWPEDLAVAPDPRAPEWANLQREGLEKLRQVALWWIHNRQKPEGFFGTGWGDDVEWWRVMVPLSVAFQDPELAASQRRLSEGVFSQPYMAKGYTDKMTDVEHSSEDFTDCVTSMLYMAPDEKVWRDRSLKVLDLARERWTGTNERGFLQFKATNFTVDRVDEDPKQACDTFYHVRVVQPALRLWQLGVSAETADFVTRWMETWVDVSLREARGKPAGITPTSIHWPDGQPGGASGDWWKPGNYHTALYDWPGAVAMIPNTMLLTYLMTDNPRYLEPIFAMAKMQRKFQEGTMGDPGVEGSPAWAASKLDQFLPTILAKYRLISGDQQFDDLLKSSASSYAKMRHTGDREPLVENLRKNAEAFRVNFPVYTSECRAGDRVMMGPARYFGLDQMTQPMPLPDLSVLYAMATGNPDMTMYCPTNAVRWWTPPTGIATLVTDASRTGFAAELFHFGEEPRAMEAEFPLLRPGSYLVTLKDSKGGAPIFSRTWVADGKARLPFELPARQLCFLEISPKP